MRQLLFRAFKGMSVHEIGLNGFGVVQIFEFVSLALKMSLIDFNFSPFNYFQKYHLILKLSLYENRFF